MEADTISSLEDLEKLILEQEEDGPKNNDPSTFQPVENSLRHYGYFESLGMRTVTGRSVIVDNGVLQLKLETSERVLSITWVGKVPKEEVEIICSTIRTIRDILSSGALPPVMQVQLPNYQLNITEERYDPEINKSIPYEEFIGRLRDFFKKEDGEDDSEQT